MGAIIGESLKKINAVREKLEPKLKIANNIVIKDVYIKDLFVGAQAEKVLAFDYLFTSNYGETTGHINIEGSVFYRDTQDKLNKIVESWKTNQNLSQEIALPVLNKALEASQVQAINIATQLKLPMPVRMPVFKAGGSTQEVKGAEDTQEVEAPAPETHKEGGEAPAEQPSE